MPLDHLLVLWLLPTKIRALKHHGERRPDSDDGAMSYLCQLVATIALQATTAKVLGAGGLLREAWSAAPWLQVAKHGDDLEDGSEEEEL